MAASALACAYRADIRFVGPNFSSAGAINKKYYQNILQPRLRSKIFRPTDDGSIFGLITEPLRRFHAGARSATLSNSVD
ncbi:hypothetical protein FF100_02745 [Methylobacterium terricola]|uniref:Uncharacterized protein n=1 Tax=Methylobacterium terricola TaxID=2583531 RepID=A0A5C4LMX9_9HYPH|nr:hypothetical protein [Methylobacterium terricola]TNC16192.1 hypothetical protein FF100_02745 [Methylobacterium terricola]